MIRKKKQRGGFLDNPRDLAKSLQSRGDGTNVTLSNGKTLTTAPSVDEINATQAAGIAKKEINRKELLRRKKAINNSNNSTLGAESFQKSASGEKLRFFPNDPESFIDEYINPLKMIGDMADNIGESWATPGTSTGQKVMSLAAPLTVGAIGGIGANSTKQFVNNIMNPIAGFGDNILDNIEIKKLRKYASTMDDYIKNPIVKKRLMNAGMTKEEIANMQLPDVSYLRNGENTYYTPAYNSINMDIDQLRAIRKSGEDISNITAFDHEFGHYLQNQIINGKIFLQNRKNTNLKDVFNSMMTQRPDLFENIPYHEVYRNLGTSSPKPIARNLYDDIAETLTPKSTKVNTSQYQYFNYDVEPMAHVREMRSNMIQKGYIKDHTSDVSEDVIRKFIKNNPKDRISSFLNNTTENVTDLKYLLNNVPAVVPVGIAAGLVAGKEMKKGGLSKMGYRDDSPYRGRKSININTPEGLIDMSQTGIPLIAEDETGMRKVLAPYSGMHQFRGTNVKETRMQNGGFNAKQIFDFIFDEDEKVTAPSTDQVPVEEEEKPGEAQVDNTEYDLAIQNAVSGDFALRNRYKEKLKNPQATYGAPVPVTAFEGKKTPPTSDKGQYAYNYLVNKGLPNHVAAGMVGNFIQESGNFRDDVVAGTKTGDNGAAHGIAQWHSDRWNNLIKWNSQQGKNPYTLDAQLDFAVYEAGQRGDLKRTAQASNSGEAANIFAKYYERPKIIDPNRANHARRYYKQLGGEIYNDLFKNEI